jgi:hypothetical protein
LGDTRNKQKSAKGKPPRTRTSVNPSVDSRKLLPKPASRSGQVDITGIMPEDIRIDPDITEGHAKLRRKRQIRDYSTEILMNALASTGIAHPFCPNVSLAFNFTLR